MERRPGTVTTVGLFLMLLVLTVGAINSPGHAASKDSALTVRLSFEEIGASDQNGKTVVFDYKGLTILSLSFAGCQTDQASGVCTIKHLIVVPSDATLELRPFPLKSFPGIAPKTYTGDAMVPLGSASQALRIYSLFSRFSWSNCTLSLYLPKDSVDEYTVEKMKDGQYSLVHRFTSRLIAPPQGALLTESIFDEYGYDDFMVNFLDGNVGGKGEVYSKKIRMYFPVDLSCCTRWPTLDGGTIQRKSEK